MFKVSVHLVLKLNCRGKKLLWLKCQWKQTEEVSWPLPPAWPAAIIPCGFMQETISSSSSFLTVDYRILLSDLNLVLACVSGVKFSISVHPKSHICCPQRFYLHSFHFFSENIISINSFSDWSFVCWKTYKKCLPFYCFKCNKNEYKSSSLVQNL